MKKISKFLSIIFAIMMVISIVPITASAEKLNYAGDSVYWLVENGKLMIYGSGEMYSYTSSTAPWRSYKDEIKEMQTLITTVTEKSNKIQVQEARNKELMTQKFAKVHKQARDVRASQQAVNQYYQNMKKLNYIDPQFMDNKK